MVLNVVGAFAAVVLGLLAVGVFLVLDPFGVVTRFVWLAQRRAHRRAMRWPGRNLRIPRSVIGLVYLPFLVSTIAAGDDSVSHGRYVRGGFYVLVSLTVWWAMRRDMRSTGMRVRSVLAWRRKRTLPWRGYT